MGKKSNRFRSFRLSEIMPNSWFNKFRDKGSTGRRGFENSMDKSHVPIIETGKALEIQSFSPKPPQNHVYIKNRPSYYVPSRSRVEKLPSFSTYSQATDTELNAKASKKSAKKPSKKCSSTHNKDISTSVSSFSTWQEQSSSHLCSETDTTIPPRFQDRVIDDELITNYHSHPVHLPPIATKPIKKETNMSNHTAKNQGSKQMNIHSHGYMRRSTPGTPRVKMRLKSPKLVKNKLRETKGVADSLAVVKSSSNPLRDFRESMLEMILQNDLWSSKDLEELLSCYLSLNSDEYHNVIVKAFKQIWFELTVMKLQFK